MLRAHEMPMGCSKTLPHYQAFHNSIKFDLGSVYSLIQLSDASTGENCKPPYPVCLFQFDVDQPDTVYFILVLDHGDGIEGIGFGHEPDPDGTGNNYWFEDGRLFRSRHGYLVKAQNDISLQWDKGFPESLRSETLFGAADQWWSERMLWMFRALDTMASSHCQIQEIPLSPDQSRMNKKRLKKGKAPFYSYKTLQLDPLAEKPGKQPPMGGTHASPRVHTRRGHVRHLPTGKDIWVKSCVVGHKELGIVEKDYRVANDPDSQNKPF